MQFTFSRPQLQFLSSDVNFPACHSIYDHTPQYNTARMYYDTNLITYSSIWCAVSCQLFCHLQLCSLIRKKIETARMRFIVIFSRCLLRPQHTELGHKWHPSPAHHQVLFFPVESCGDLLSECVQWTSQCAELSLIAPCLQQKVESTHLIGVEMNASLTACLTCMDECGMNSSTLGGS